MAGGNPLFEVRLARGEDDLRAAQRLRYDVFVAEMGSAGSGVDHGNRLECDDFDAAFDHLLLIDHAGPGVVGTCRLGDAGAAGRAGRFYSEAEYDLAPLVASGRRLMELGRSCLHPAYRGGPAMYHLWHGLSGVIAGRGAEILFGTASFPGTDPAALAHPLSFLHHHHLAPAGLRPRSRTGERMDLLPPSRIDRRAAMLATPALIKAYLRLGGVVGEGAWVDRAFNTTDVLMILDTARMNAAAGAIYTRGGRA